MPHRDLTEICTVARALEIVGDRWTVLILRDAFHGLLRFDDFVADLGISRNILTDRLSRLVEHGVLERRRYQENPPRDEYRLTAKGRDLLPVLLALMQWGDRWTADGEPPVRLEHVACGHVSSPVLVCDHCRDELEWKQLRLDPVPVRRPARQR